MTHTAEPMTLEKWIVITNNNEAATPILLFTSMQAAKQYCANNPGPKYRIYCAIDAELAKQRNAHQGLFTDTLSGKYVGLHGTKESVEALEAYIDAKQRNAVEVTDEMAEIVIEAVYGDSWCDYSRTAEVRKAMVAALSAVASRDREDAERYRWLKTTAQHEKCAYWFRVVANEGSIEEAIDAARRENRS